MKKALITGITGQDGSYLAEFLLSKGYEVHGVIRRASTFNTHRIDHIYKDPHTPGVKLFLHYGDLSDSGVINGILWNVEPDEIYHLGAQSPAVETAPWHRLLHPRADRGGSGSIPGLARSGA